MTEQLPKLRVPLAKPRPDIGAYLNTMLGRKPAAKPPLAEYLVDNVIMKPVLEMMGRKCATRKLYDDAGRGSQLAPGGRGIQD